MNKPHTLSVDLETYSSVDIGKCGVYRYTESDDFEILLFAYSCDYGPVTVIDLTRNDGVPTEIVDWLYDPAVEKTAFNAAFERTCLTKWFGRYCEPEQWSCTMILSASCGLPLSLAGVGAALELPEDKAKMKEGKELIRYFCQPCRPTKANGGRTRNRPEDAPDKWATFIEYNRRDVETENTIRQRLLKWRPDYSEQKLWCLDQRMNDKGVRIEPKLAENAIRIGDKYREELLTKCKQLTGLENPNSTAQIKSWLEEQEGIEVLSLNKKAIADVYASLNADQTKEVLKLREEFSKSSNKKYEAFLRCKCNDDHIRGMFQFYGANQTGRWAGRLCQLQNLSHDTLPDLDDARMWAMLGDPDDFECMYPKVQHALSTLIRTVLIPEENSRFIVCDFSAIEARVLAWIANESWRLEAFENGRDIYCESASKAFKIPVEKHGVNASYRSVGKTLELACIAEDQLVLTDHGLVPIQNVTTEMRLWDGESFVSHDGVVCQGEKFVIAYQGLEATPDHPVFITGIDEAVPFGWAAIGGWALRDGMYPTDYDLKARYCRFKVKVYDILNAGPNHRYTVSGKLVHNCGYGGGVGAMKNFGADKLGMSEEAMSDAVSKWRDASPHVVALWQSLDEASKRCIKRGKPTISTVGHIRFDIENGVMWMTLPSGRRIAYWGVAMGQDRWGRPSMTYMSQNQQTKKWERTETYGAKLVENCCQATARDVLKEALFNLDKAGYDVRATVHDEVIITVPNGFGSCEEVEALMCKGAAWTKGLPLNAESYECSSYRKE